MYLYILGRLWKTLLFSSSSRRVKTRGQMRLQNGTLCRVCSHLRSVAATLRLACLEGREEKRNICCPIILLFLSLLLFFLKVRQIKTVETDEEQAAGTDENANKVVQFRCVHPGLGVYYVIVVQSLVY